MRPNRRTVPANRITRTLAPVAGALLLAGAEGRAAEGDRAALQALLDSGKPVAMEGRTWRIDAALNVPAGGGLVGPGVIVHDFDPGRPDAPAPNDAALIVRGDGVRLEGFRIEKRFVDGSYSVGITAEHVRRLSVRNVEITGYSARYGIHLVECADFEVAGCHIHGFSVDVVTDMIRDSPAGLRITRSRRGIVANNRIHDILVGPRGRAGVSPLVPTYGPQGYQSDLMTIVDCREIAITGNQGATSGEGIDLLLSRSCSASGNVISDIWFQAIKMLGVSDCAVTGNHLADCYQGVGLAGHPMRPDGATGNAIAGNVIRGVGATGSFGVAATNRVRYGSPCGVDLHDAGCRFNAVHGNAIGLADAAFPAIGGRRDPSNAVSNNTVRVEPPPAP